MKVEHREQRQRRQSCRELQREAGRNGAKSRVRLERERGENEASLR